MTNRTFAAADDDVMHIFGTSFLIDVIKSNLNFIASNLVGQWEAKNI